MRHRGAGCAADFAGYRQKMLNIEMPGRLLVLALLSGILSCRAQEPPLLCAGNPCPVGEGNISYSRDQVMLTAVGCVQEFKVSFGSAISSTNPVSISLCERNSQGNCVTKNPVDITSAVVSVK